MRLNAFKFVMLIGLVIIIALGFFAPFVELHDPSSVQSLSMSYSQLLQGRSAELMPGAKAGALAAMPAASLLICLFLPNYCDNNWTSKRISVVTLCAAVVLLAALVWPLMQAAVMIFGYSFVGVYGMKPLWGAYALMYCGSGLLIFMILSAIPAVRRSALGMN